MKHLNLIRQFSYYLQTNEKVFFFAPISLISLSLNNSFNIFIQGLNHEHFLSRFKSLHVSKNDVRQAYY